jgi:hypothetical protein
VEIILALWLFFGATALISFSSAAKGQKKYWWVALSLGPLLLSIIVALVSVILFPEHPFHAHSNHFPAISFFSITGTWTVYAFFRHLNVRDRLSHEESPENSVKIEDPPRYY